ncbi:hypothetical protein ASPWEDRAFT_186153 [Aspergillus wentii DTO 134E9]|uniref:Uncharacterized protein n=1 Tax=Aspergillus wentii DTO 134E9 TaxID=1073089 RepID=A0A1L9RAM6_ASPWE|nr:uncharacterized protein ASPWEDRAFT_186153 [Aspergillus wentii DTO 134E9]OJJ31907.1 hypothetical protein ASPWEDRAFT_186153 [Aspergillus wentii DTO 134E9]
MHQPTRTFKISFTSWSCRHIQVTEHDTPLYIADVHTRKPNMIFKTHPSETQFATVTLHALSSHTDIILDNQDTVLNLKSGFRHQANFTSRTLQTTLEWNTKSLMKGYDFELVDQNGTPLAQYINDWCHNTAKVDIFFNLNEAVIREIVVTGLALVYGRTGRLTTVNTHTGDSAGSLVAAGVI